jgi:hypothetical protein
VVDGPAIESQWGVRFYPLFHPVSCTMGTGVRFPEVKLPGRGVDHPPHLTLRLKNE